MYNCNMYARKIMSSAILETDIVIINTHTIVTTNTCTVAMHARHFIVKKKAIKNGQ